MLKKAHKFSKSHSYRQTFDLLFLNSDVKYCFELLPTVPQMLGYLVADMQEAALEDEKAIDVTVADFKQRVSDRLIALWTGVKGRYWRTAIPLLRHIPGIDATIESAGLNSLFLKEFLEILERGHCVAKQLAAEATCELLLNCCVESQRRAAVERVLSLTQSPNFGARLAFHQFCQAACKHFSREFVHSSGLMAKYLAMAADGVVNVRIRFVRIARVMFDAAHDEDTEDAVVDKLNLLRNDKNKDVRRIADSVYCEIKDHISDCLKAKQAHNPENAIRLHRELALIEKQHSVASF